MREYGTMKRGDEKKRRAITVLLSAVDVDLLEKRCAERGQSKSDFFRSAIRHGEELPIVHSKQPLAGACLDKHLARLAREKRKDRRHKS